MGVVHFIAPGSSGVFQWKADVGAALAGRLLIRFKEAALSEEIAYDHAAKAQVCSPKGARQDEY
jgi:hypothetical protein